MCAENKITSLENVANVAANFYTLLEDVVLAIGKGAMTTLRVKTCANDISSV
jgi:hypothetical protein